MLQATCSCEFSSSLYPFKEFKRDLKLKRDASFRSDADFSRLLSFSPFSLILSLSLYSTMVITDLMDHLINHTNQSILLAKESQVTPSQLIPTIKSHLITPTLLQPLPLHTHSQLTEVQYAMENINKPSPTTLPSPRLDIIKANKWEPLLSTMNTT